MSGNGNDFISTIKGGGNKAKVHFSCNVVLSQSDKFATQEMLSSES